MNGQQLTKILLNGNCIKPNITIKRIEKQQKQNKKSNTETTRLNVKCLFYPTRKSRLYRRSQHYKAMGSALS